MVAIVDIACIQVPNRCMQVSSECAPVSSHGTCIYLSNIDIDLYDTCSVTDSLVCMHRLTCRMVAIADIECIQVPNQCMQVSRECAPVSSHGTCKNFKSKPSPWTKKGVIVPANGAV